MVEIIQLIKARQASYDDLSKKILEPYKETLNKALQYYMKEDRSITWTNIEIISGNEKFVTITGYLRIKSGDLLIVNGERIIASEEFVTQHPVNVMRLVLPVLILQKNEPEEIFEHIKIFDQLKQVMSPEDLIAMAKKLKIDTLADILSNEAILDQITKPKVFEGFDIEQLDNIQQLQIRCFTEHGSKLKN